MAEPDSTDYIDIGPIWYYVSAESGRVLLVETPGPKSYRRIWLDQPAHSDDWTWVKPDHAVELPWLQHDP